jgi:quercetin dioxygenase-like cupin family protein
MVIRLVIALLVASSFAPAHAQSADTNATGYYVRQLAENIVTQLPPGPLYWRVETLPTEAAAHSNAGKGPYALTAEVAGRHWLFTLGPRGGSTPGAARIAEIGPVATPAARRYLLRINHAGGPPRSHTPVHTHPGSEAIYVLRGEISQRTAMGVNRAGAGQALNAHAPEMVMQIESSGAVDLEQLVMFVVDADRPFSPAASFEP